MKTHAEAMERKTESLADIRNCLERSSIAIVTDYRGATNGLTVKQITDLRNRLRKVNGEFRVVKNTLTKKAAKDLGYQGLDPILEGPTAIAFGYDDPSAVTKTLLDFVNENKATSLPAVRGGYFEGTAVKPDQLKAIADMPSREQLLGQILGLMLANHRNLLGVLNAPGRQVATVIEAWRKKQEEG